MADLIPQSVLERLEREWRLVDVNRPEPEPKSIQTEAAKRIRIGRVD